MKKINHVFFGLLLITLTQCSPETKQNLGFVKAAPDEYKVTKHEGLSIPKNAKLVQPGNQSDIKRKKQLVEKTSAILLGVTPNRKIPMHESEKALASELDIKSHKDIYKKLSEDQRKEEIKEAKWQSKMKDSVMFWKQSNKKKANVIDAEKEAERLGLDIKKNPA